MSSFKFLLLLPLLFLISSSQMVPVPDLESTTDPKNMVPDPFHLPQFKKYVDPLVLTLTPNTFNEVMLNFPHIVVLFKSSSNKEIEEGYERLAKNIRKNNQVIFGVYTPKPENDEFLPKFKVHDFPGIFFVDKTKKYPFSGNMSNLTEVKTFIMDFLFREIIEIKTQSDFLAFHNRPNKTKLLAVYGHNMKKERKLLEEMLKNDLFADSGPFIIGLTEDQSIVPYPENVELPSLILYNHFTEEEEANIVKYDGDFNDGQEILAFTQLNSLPLVSVFKEENSFRIFAGAVDVQMLMLLNKNRDNSKEIEEFKKAAKFNKEEELHFERIIFCIVYFEEENKDFLDFFGIEKEEDLKEPKIFITKIDNQIQKMDKFLFEKDEIIQEYIKDFTEEFRKKQLRRFYKSDPPIDNTNNWPVILVGSEFNQEVIRSRTNFVVLFCSNNEIRCKGAISFFNKIAKRVSNDDRNIVKFAYFDVSRNEADGLEIYNIPHLSIYLKGEKKKPKNYVDEIDLVKMWKFVWAYFESKIQLPAFTQEEIEDAHIELMDEEDKIKILEAKERLKKAKMEQVVEGIEDDDEINADKKEEVKKNEL